MATIDSVLKSVLAKITPTEKEREETNRIKKIIVEAAQEIIKPHSLEMTLAGSYIRDTWMRHKKEFDVFVIFPEACKREELEKLGLDIGKKLTEKLKGKHTIAYAEHPYVRAKIAGYDVDIVPCYKLKSGEKIKSAVDRTPLHNQWLLQHLKKEMSPEVRLLKQFTTSAGVYGSDMKTLGFSGYLCELLIINYGSFKNLAKEASNWKAAQFIDVWGRHKQPIKLEKFKNQPLIVIDPVDAERNVATVLSPENFAKFTNACRNLMKNPSEKFFFRPAARINTKALEAGIKKRGTQMIAILFDHPQILPDILYPQLRKTAGRLKGLLEHNEFAVMGFDVWGDGKKCAILLELEVWGLPVIRKLEGPSIFSKKGSSQFLEKYRRGRVWVEEDKWIAETNRKFLTAEEGLKAFLKDSEKNLLEKGVASYIAQQVSKGFRLAGAREIIRLAQNKSFGEFLVNYLEKDYTK